MKDKITKIIALGFFLAFSGCILPSTPTNSYNFDTLDSKMAEGLCQCKESKVSMFYRYLVTGSTPINQPLVIFLHGAGGNGYDNKLNIRDSGLGNLSYFINTKTTATLVVPQCPLEVQWPEDRMVEAIDEFIDHCIQKFAPDKSRIYITGYSMGGIGTWKVVQKYPSRFAAAIPICGGPLTKWEYDSPEVPEEMKDLDIWAFNSINDTVIQNIYSKNVMQKLWDGQTTKAHFTEGFKGHTDNWVYADEDVMSWMMQQKKK